MIWHTPAKCQLHFDGKTVKLNGKKEIAKRIEAKTKDRCEFE